MILNFRNRGLGMAIVRDEPSKNILAILGKQDLLLFVMRMFSVEDRERILEESVESFKIMRSLDSIIYLKQTDTLFTALDLIKRKNVKITSCRSFPFSTV